MVRFNHRFDRAVLVEKDSNNKEYRYDASINRD